MVARLLEHFGYLAILALLGAAGFGVPIPEELTQLTAGFLAHQGYLHFAPSIVTCWIGIVGGDFAFYSLARRHGPRILSSRPVRRVLTPERAIWLERHFSRHAFWTIAIARHASGLRIPAFALAGAHCVRRRTFLLADGLSALVSVPLVVSVGYLFSHHLTEAHRDIRRVEFAILAVATAAAGVLLLVRARRRSRRAEGS